MRILLITLIVLFVLFVLLIPGSIADDEISLEETTITSHSLIVDEMGILDENTKNDIDKLIENLNKDRNVNLKVEINATNFPGIDEFKNYGIYLFRNSLGRISKYDVFILYSKVNGKPYIGYFHSYECSIFTNQMKDIIGGELSGNPDGGDIYSIASDVVETINFTLDISGKECVLNVCELINEGNDTRYEGYKCDDFIPEESKRPYTCIKYDENKSKLGALLCLYAKGFEVADFEKNKNFGNITFIIDDNDWRSALSLLPIAAYRITGDIDDILDKVKNEEERDKIKNNMRLQNSYYNPWIVYHRENDSTDLESIVIYLKQLLSINEKRPEEIVLITKDELPYNLKLALFNKDIGLGLSEIQDIKISSMTPDSYYKLWEEKEKDNKYHKFDSLVISDPDDYPMGLYSAHFASFMNAPLLFLDASDDYEKIIDRYRKVEKYEYVYFMGNVNQKIKEYAIKKSKRDEPKAEYANAEEVQNAMYSILNTDKMMLINPKDRNYEHCENFSFYSSFGEIEYPYCGDSINAPLLASMKNEIMVITDTEPAKYDMAVSRCKRDIVNLQLKFIDRNDIIYSYDRRDKKYEYYDRYSIRKREILEEIRIPLSLDIFSFVTSPDRKYIYGIKAVFSTEWNPDTKEIDDFNNYSFYNLDRILNSTDSEKLKPDFSIAFKGTHGGLGTKCDLDHCIESNGLPVEVDNEGNVYSMVSVRSDSDKNGIKKNYILLLKYNKSGGLVINNRIFYKGTGTEEQIKNFVNSLKSDTVKKNPDLDFVEGEDKIEVITNLQVSDNDVIIFYEVWILRKDPKKNFVMYELIANTNHDLSLKKINIRNVEFTHDSSPWEMYIESDREGNICYTGYNARKNDFVTINEKEWNYYDLNVYMGEDIHVEKIFSLSTDKLLLVVENDIYLELDKKALFSDKEGSFKVVGVHNLKEYCVSIRDRVGIDKQILEWEDDINRIATSIKREIQNFIENKNMNFLTIVSGPKFIPMSKHLIPVYPESEYRLPLDSYYANLGNSEEEKTMWNYNDKRLFPYFDKEFDGVEDISVGRIFGITNSDSSSYINRVITFEKNGKINFIHDKKLEPLKSLSLMAADFAEMQGYIPDYVKKFDDSGYEVKCYVGDETLAKKRCVFTEPGVIHPEVLNKNLFYHTDHGTTSSLEYAGISSIDIPDLSSTVGITDSCLTNDYYTSTKDYLFGSNIIRKGGIAQIGSVSVTSAGKMDLGKYILVDIFNGVDIGTALKNAKKSYINDYTKNGLYEINYILFGDPTVNVAIGNKINW